MYTFVTPDIHGRPESLRALLWAAGVIDENGVRLPTKTLFNVPAEFMSISLGDLANGVLKDANGDEECLLRADRDNWFDLLIMGNHEGGYIFDNLGFDGYVPVPPVKSLYRSMYMRGKVVPAALVGNTLLTHAGVVEEFQFITAREAFRAIMDVWERYNNSVNYDEKWEFARYGIPKPLILEAVAKKRGGNAPFGGILWADWREPKNFNFSQVHGHTPMPEGPVKTNFISNGTYTLNLDAGAKGGMEPWGVWLDAMGDVVEFVKADLGRDWS